MENSEAAALASLAITESLMLALQDNGVLSESEAMGLLEDARDAHLNTDASRSDPELHRRAAEYIETLRLGMDGTGRFKPSD